MVISQRSEKDDKDLIFDSSGFLHIESKIGSKKYIPQCSRSCFTENRFNASRSFPNTFYQ